MFISKMVHSSVNLPPSNRNNERVNGRFPKFAAYLLVLFVAKSLPTLRLSKGVKEIDNSIYFTLYKLWQIAKSFKDLGPWHLPITYDRTKVAVKIYNMISNNGLVTIKKIDGGSYITTTKKGDDESEGLLEDLGAYLDNDSEDRLVAKGGTRYDPESQKEERKRLAERITKINLPFEDELKTIEDDIYDEGEWDGDDQNQTE